MATAPTIEWRNSTSPFATISSLALTGSGTGGAIFAGNGSNVATVRVYNNFAAAASIADATSCTLACYDDTTHQGQMTSGIILLVNVINYNGSTSGADAGSPTFFQISGTNNKHPVPTNGGTISGSGSNYITVQVAVFAASTASAGSVSVGLWLEYTSTA